MPVSAAVSAQADVVKRQVETLRTQLNIERTPVSASAAALLQFIQEHQGRDYFITGIPNKENPWIPASKPCNVL